MGRLLLAVVVLAVIGAVAACAPSGGVRGPVQNDGVRIDPLPEARQPDIGYLMHPDSIEIYRAVPGADSLEDIIRVGARALDWVDLLQKDTPIEKREQIWRRVDRIGREPTPETPFVYNPGNIVEEYNKAIEGAPASVVEVIKGKGELPGAVPAGLTIKDVVSAVRGVHTVYSRASRWLVLYQWRFAMGKGRSDFRGWVKIKKSRDALISMTGRWDSLTRSDRERFVNDLAEACPLAIGASVKSCKRSYGKLVDRPDDGVEALGWLSELLDRGQRVYDSKFGVARAHEGVRTHVEGGFHQIEMPTVGIDAETFAWIQQRVDEAWFFKGFIGVKLFQTSGGRGAVRVDWEKGALPHVNGIAGDVITMDSNTPKWLEHTQTVMRHEFGHVLGFPDCYVEFWDDDVNSFVFYSLDPVDAMCALSGEYFERHREALIRGYF